MTNLNTKSRILISVILIASTLGVFIYAQGADLTLDSVLGIYNARWINGTDAALSTGVYVDLINEYSPATGVTIDGVLIKDDKVVAVGYTIGANTLDTEWPFLDGQDQSVFTTSAVTFITVDTGQGANDLYAMDQDVEIGDSPTFAGMTLSGLLDANAGADIEGAVKIDHTGVPVIVTRTSSIDNSAPSVLQLLASTTEDTIADGFGASLLFRIKDNLGSMTSIASINAVRDGDDSSGALEFYTDTGSQLALTLEADTTVIVTGNVIPDTNNTGSVGEDPVRFADGYFVTVTAKNTVTGKIIENEIKANPLESFEEGDLVQILDTQYFTKTTNKLANVIGVVTLNPGNIQIGTETVTAWVDKVQDVTRSVSWFEDVTDAYGTVYEVERTREMPVYEWYLEMVEETLSDGNTVLYYENRTRPTTEIVSVEVTTKTPVMGPKNEPVLCVFGGPTLVKISEPVLKHDVLVASAVDGEARPLRTVLPELVEQFGDMEMNFENVLMAIEKLNYKTLGRVMEDSTGDTCWAMIGY